MDNENKRKEMSKVRTIPKICAIVLIMIVCVISYFKIKEIQSYPPEQEEKSSYSIQTTEYMNRKVFTMTPTENKSDKVIIFFHGGSYMGEMTDGHWEFLKKISNDTKATIIVPDYPLAPKYTCQDVFNMVEPLYKDLTKDMKSDNLILMGDSAGGGLSLALMEKLNGNNEHYVKPSKLILISPWLDASMENEKIQEVQEKDENLNANTLKLAGIAYAGGLDLKNYLVSPIYGDLKNIPNMYIFTGTCDILNPDVYVLENKVKEIGGFIKVNTYQDAQHDWVIERNCDNKLIEQGYNDIVSTINS